MKSGRQKPQSFQIDGHEVTVTARTWLANFAGWWVRVDGKQKVYVGCLEPRQAAELAVKRLTPEFHVTVDGDAIDDEPECPRCCRSVRNCACGI